MGSQAKDAHVGQVKEFHSPAAPAKPESLSSADLAKELSAYDASVRCNSILHQYDSDIGPLFIAQSPAETNTAAATSTDGEVVEHRESADDFLEALRAPPAQEAHH